MTADQGLGEEPAEPPQEGEERGALFRRARVGGTAGGVQSALVTDADAATVVGTAVGADLQQATVLRHDAGAADVEVVTDGAEATLAVVAQELFRGVVARAAGGRAVDNQVADAFGRRHQRAVFHSGKELALVGHLLLTDNQGIGFCNHNSQFIMHNS